MPHYDPKVFYAAIDGTSHEKQIPSNEPQQKTYFQQTNHFH
jgi:hypothetical protein